MQSLALKTLVLVSMLGVGYAMEINPRTAEELIAGPPTTELKPSVSVNLVVRTDKINYRLEETVTAYVHLENMEKQPVYISKFFEINASVSSGISLALDIFDSDGNPPGGRGAASAAYGVLYLNYQDKFCESDVIFLTHRWDLIQPTLMTI